MGEMPSLYIDLSSKIPFGFTYNFFKKHYSVLKKKDYLIGGFLNDIKWPQVFDALQTINNVVSKALTTRMIYLCSLFITPRNKFSVIKVKDNYILKFLFAMTTYALKIKPAK